MDSSLGKENHYPPHLAKFSLLCELGFFVLEKLWRFLIRWIFQGVFHEESAACGCVLHLLKDGVVKWMCM